jgi:hypothetical protein
MQYKRILAAASIIAISLAMVATTSLLTIPFQQHADAQLPCPLDDDDDQDGLMLPSCNDDDDQGENVDEQGDELAPDDNEQ